MRSDLWISWLYKGAAAFGAESACQKTRSSAGPRSEWRQLWGLRGAGFWSVVILLIGLGKAMGDPLDDGLSFLLAQQTPLGNWESSEVRTLHSTTAVIEVWQNLGTGNIARQAAANYLQAISPADHDEAARRIISLVGEGLTVSTAVAALLAEADPAGGWGLTPEFVSDPLDTALALNALGAAGRITEAAIVPALAALLDHQNSDGGWPCVTGGESSDVACTAGAILALSFYRGPFALDYPIDAGASFLLASINNDGSIGPAGKDQIYTTALAVHALLAVGEEIPGQRLGVERFLEETQSGDGSWLGDTLFTAEAVNALHSLRTLPFCGDGALNTAGEACDGADLAGTSCTALGFGQGTLACSASCDFDTAGCGPSPLCGDGLINRSDEACDGLDLAGQTCESLGFGSGSLECAATCTFNTGGCTVLPVCGDGLVNQVAEVCDGADLGGQSCESLGLGAGTLACNASCRLEASGCSAEPICGDGVVNRPTERCDAEDLAGLSCEALGATGGSLACLSACSNFDVAGCSNLPDADLDGFLAGADCDDNDAAVNPDREEVAFNGKDDDCDLRTPDILTTCGVEVVFTMDTSASMNDEASALCNRISQVKANLESLGIDTTTHLLGITSTGGSGFSCLTDHVQNLLGSTVPGDEGSCDGFLNHNESWGQSTSIVADRFPWIPESIRVIVPISDEGPCNGNYCFNPGFDRDSIENAIDFALQGDIFVSPIVGTSANTCVKDLASLIATGTGGTLFVSTDPNIDLAGAIASLVVGACEQTLAIEVAPSMALNAPGTLHALTAIVTNSLGMAQAGRDVRFEILAGPNAGTAGTVPSGANGDAVFEYTSSGARGVDEIVASVVDNIGRTVKSPAAFQFWDSDCNTNGISDTCDLDCRGFNARCNRIQGCGLHLDTDGNEVPDACQLSSVRRDDDGDGFPMDSDCDDTYSAVNPAATEVVGNGIDDDCNPATPDEITQDQVACALVTDKAAYGANEAVRIEVDVRNTSAIESLAGLAFALLVQGPGGSVLGDTREALSPLVPGALRERSFFVTTGTTPAGALSAFGSILAGTETVTACSATATIETSPVLTGTIAADPDDVVFGNPALLRFTVENAGNIAIDPAEIEVVVVDPTTETVVDQFADRASLAPGETVQDEHTTVRLEVGDYVAVLRGGPVNESEPLASAPLRVVGPAQDMTPIQDLRVRAKIGKVNLVWTPVSEAVGYNIYRQDGDGPLTLVQTGHVTDYAVYADFGLTNGVTYTYIVRWLDAAGRESPDSNVVTATPNQRSRRR